MSLKSSLQLRSVTETSELDVYLIGPTRNLIVNDVDLFEFILKESHLNFLATNFISSLYNVLILEVVCGISGSSIICCLRVDLKLMKSSSETLVVLLKPLNLVFTFIYVHEEVCVGFFTG